MVSEAMRQRNITPFFKLHCSQPARYLDVSIAKHCDDQLFSNYLSNVRSHIYANFSILQEEGSPKGSSMSVTLRTLIAAGNDPAATMAAFAQDVTRVDIVPDFIFCFYGCELKDDRILSILKDRFPNAAVLGGTSSNGIMSASGPAGKYSIGALLVSDPDGDYGVAAEPFGDDPKQTATEVLAAALSDADCPGELPELIWIYQAPGHEEAVLAGLREIVGDRCPIVGGSSADNLVSGNWRQLSDKGVLTNGIVVGVVFSSGGVSVAFEGGYEPTGATGIVTNVAGSGVVTRHEGRHVLTIDDRPAAEVLNDWLDGAITAELEAGGSILAATTLTPIGIDTGGDGKFAHYRLVHPASITNDRGFTTFATIESGTRLFSMRGDRRRLIDRAGRVAMIANEPLRDSTELAGGLVVYCGGCMMAVGEEMGSVSQTLAQSFGSAPWLCCFTFGEQGPVLGSNMHGNLMISTISFGA